jgi:transposase-like protein
LTLRRAYADDLAGFHALFLYAQGMKTREIVRTFKEMYGADA